LNKDLETAIELVRAGKRNEAGPIFSRIVQKEPDNERAWLGLAACVAPLAQRKYCLEQVIRINPRNVYARRMLGLKSEASAMAPVPQAVPEAVVTSVRSAAPPPAPVEQPVQASRETPTSARSVGGVGARFEWPAPMEENPAPLDLAPDLRSRPRRRSPHISSLAISFIFLLTFLGVMAAIIAIISSAKPVHPVRFEVTGSYSATSIQWLDENGTMQKGTFPLPFVKTLGLKEGELAYITAVHSSGTGALTCRIWVDGEIWNGVTRDDSLNLTSCRGLITGP
jgi:hypothetical protein